MREPAESGDASDDLMKRWLLVALTVLVLLLVGADFGLRAVAQNVVSRELKSSLKLSASPSVSLHGFPFLLHLAEGRFSTASATGTGLKTDGITFQSVQFTLTDLAFSPSKLVSGSDATITAASGSGTVTLTGPQATAALNDQGIDVTVEFVGGHVRLRSSRVPGELSADLSISASGSKLVVRSADPQLPLAVTVPLPTFVTGIRFTDVRLVGSDAILNFSLDHPSFPVGRS